MWLARLGLRIISRDCAGSHTSSFCKPFYSTCDLQRCLIGIMQIGRSSVKPRVSVQDSTGTSDLWTRAHLCSHLQATNILALGLDHLLEHEAVGRTISLTQGPGTDCSTTLTSGGAIPSPSAQEDYLVREGVWLTRLSDVFPDRYRFQRPRQYMYALLQ